MTQSSLPAKAAHGPVWFALAISPSMALAGSLSLLLLGGARLAVGFLIGAALSWTSLLLGAWVVKTSVRAASNKVAVISKLELLLLIKLPIMAIVVFFANSLGRGATLWFLAGYLLVYFGLLVGALRPKRAPSNCEEAS